MKTYLKPSGDCFILEIDKKVLEGLNIDPGKPVEVLLSPASDGTEAIILQALNDLDNRYMETMKRLSE